MIDLGWLFWGKWGESLRMHTKAHKSTQKATWPAEYTHRRKLQLTFIKLVKRNSSPVFKTRKRRAVNNIELQHNILSNLGGIFQISPILWKPPRFVSGVFFFLLVKSEISGRPNVLVSSAPTYHWKGGIFSGLEKLCRVKSSSLRRSVPCLDVFEVLWILCQS